MWALALHVTCHLRIPFHFSIRFKISSKSTITNASFFYSGQSSTNNNHYPYMSLATWSDKFVVTRGDNRSYIRRIYCNRYACIIKRESWNCRAWVLRELRNSGRTAYVSRARAILFLAVLVPVEFITRLIYNSIAVGYGCNTEAACIGRQTEAKNWTSFYLLTHTHLSRF